MNKRPLSITIFAWIYMAVGAIGFAYHFTEIRSQRSFQYDIVWVELVRSVPSRGDSLFSRFQKTDDVIVDSATQSRRRDRCQSATWTAQLSLA